MCSKKYLISFVFIFFIAICGCSTRIDDFTIISRKNINYNSGSFFVGKKVIGKHTSMNNPSVYQALDNALSDRCAVALENATFIYRNGFWNKYAIVEGYVVYDRNIPGCENKE